MSNLFRSMSLLAATGLALASAPLAAHARVVSARSGSSSYFHEGSCWAVWGPMIINSCTGMRSWHVPLVLDGGGFIAATVTAQGAGPLSNVTCRLEGWTKEGDIAFFSQTAALPFFGQPANMTLSGVVPAGGSANVECSVMNGGRVITVSH